MKRAVKQRSKRGLGLGRAVLYCTRCSMGLWLVGAGFGCGSGDRGSGGGSGGGDRSGDRGSGVGGGNTGWVTEWGGG